MARRRQRTALCQSILVLFLPLPLVFWQVNSHPSSPFLPSENCVFQGRGRKIVMAESQGLRLLWGRYLVTRLVFFILVICFLFPLPEAVAAKRPQLRSERACFSPCTNTLASKTSGLRGRAGAGHHLLIFQLIK